MQNGIYGDQSTQSRPNQHQRWDLYSKIMSQMKHKALGEGFSQTQGSLSSSDAQSTHSRIFVQKLFVARRIANIPYQKIIYLQ
jgi:hypothetical protein